ncbi:MAG: tetratricopeptide repeat protein [Alphaproteobacteria bacterium]|nr:tetratricopeptide repeat protein [Alphaproteobacteria bacterium]
MNQPAPPESPPDGEEPIADTIRRGLLLHAEGDLAQAEHVYRTVLDRDPDCPDALHLLGLVAHATGHLEQAESLIGRAVELLPSKAVFLSNLGNVYLSMKQPARAEQAFLRTMEIDPDLAAASHDNIGLVMSAQGRFAEAALSFRRAIDIDPGMAGARVHLCDALLDQGLLGEAEAEARRAAALTPDDPAVVARLARIIHRQGRFAEAAAEAEALLDRFPESAPLLNASGLARLDLGQPVLALERFERAEEGTPRVPETYELRKRAEALQPGDPELLALLMAARERGRITVEVKESSLRVVHTPLNVEFYATRAFILVVVAWGAAFWLLPTATAAGLAGGVGLLYALVGRRLVAGRMRRYALTRMAADPALWQRVWRFGALSVRDPQTGEAVVSPDGNWRLLAEKCRVSLSQDQDAP